jgi:hypothetical protein
MGAPLTEAGLSDPNGRFFRLSLSYGLVETGQGLACSWQVVEDVALLGLATRSGATSPIGY